MTTNNESVLTKSSPLGGTEGVSLIKNRSAFFGHLQHGLQGYFDNHDRKFGGIIHFAVGIRNGRVVGIIRRDSPLPFAPKEYLGEGLYYQKRRTLPKKNVTRTKKVRSNDNNE